MIQQSSSKIIKARWITPEEQLDLLDPKYYAKEALKFYPEIGLDMGGIIGNLSVKESPKLTNWYTALELLDALPARIPPLAANIDGILESPCPIYGSDKKIGDTHSLYLIPSGSLNELEIKIQDCGERLYPNENSLQFRHFWNQAREEHGDIQTDDVHWILMTDDVMPNSRNQSYQTQVQMIEDLSKKTGIDYEVPHLKDALMAIFFKKIATDENLYTEGTEQNNNLWTFTRVQETTLSYYLVVGGFTPYGLDVYGSSSYALGHIGVAALRMLGQ